MVHEDEILSAWEVKSLGCLFLYEIRETKNHSQIFVFLVESQLYWIFG